MNSTTKLLFKSAIGACLSGLFALSSVSAGLLSYEGFNYERRQWTEASVSNPEGIDGLNGGFGWDGPWEETSAYLTGIAAEARDFNDDDGLIAGARTEVLTYTDSQGRKLLTQPGQVRTSTSNSSYAARKLAQPLGEPGETIWLSFLAQAANSDNTRWSFVELNENITTHYLRFGQGNGKNRWGYDARSTTNVRIQDAPGPLVTEPVMFLAKIEFPIDTENDPVNISYWFNPDLGSESELGEPETFQSLYKPLEYLVVRGRVSIDFDEIRIGTTFDSVTPHGPFAENVAIARATTIRFETEWDKEYRSLHSEDGENWTRMQEEPIEGNAAISGLSHPEAIDASSLRIVSSKGEICTPDLSGNPVLNVTDGLALHMDASATDTLTLSDGFYVEEWRDAQGNDIVFTPLAVETQEDTRPFYFESGQGPNNRPTLLFDESSLDSISPAAFALANDIEGITFFSVVKNAQAASQNIFRISLPNSFVGIRFVQFRTSGFYDVQFRRETDDTDPYTLKGGARAPGVWSVDGSMIDYLGGKAYLFLNGEELDYLDNIEKGRTDAVDAGYVRIGSSTRPDLQNTWQGGIAEILFYNRALSNEERNSVGTYLADKYNLNYELAVEDEIPFEAIESVTLSFAAELGESYAIEWSNDLSEPWSDLGVELTGLGLNERVYFTIDDASDREFFRLRKEIK